MVNIFSATKVFIVARLDFGTSFVRAVYMLMLCTQGVQIGVSCFFVHLKAGVHASVV